jgi:hypothetical protein
MSTVAEIKLAVERLPGPERLELFHWFEETAEVRAEKLAALREDLALGLDQADRGELISGDKVFQTLRNDAGCGT